MLAGKRAFDGDDLSEILGSVLKVEPDWSKLPADLPRDVRKLLPAMPGEECEFPQTDCGRSARGSRTGAEGTFRRRRCGRRGKAVKHRMEDCGSMFRTGVSGAGGGSFHGESAGSSRDKGGHRHAVVCGAV